MIVRPNPSFLSTSQVSTISNAITSEPESGEYKIKKLRLASDQVGIKVTHSSAAEA